MRAEWVARSLPSAELAAFARAQMFDICDIANRSAVLISSEVFFVFFEAMNMTGLMCQGTVTANSMQQLLCA